MPLEPTTLRSQITLTIVMNCENNPSLATSTEAYSFQCSFKCPFQTSSNVSNFELLLQTCFSFASHFLILLLQLLLLLFPLWQTWSHPKFGVALDVVMTFDVNSCCKPIKDKKNVLLCHSYVANFPWRNWWTLNSSFTMMMLLCSSQCNWLWCKWIKFHCGKNSILKI
jgi:hypothetical protein